MRPQTVFCAVTALVLSASSASAAGFREPYSIDLIGGTPLASAIDAAGGAVVGGVRGTPGNRRVELALRTRAGRPWTTTDVARIVLASRGMGAAVGWTSADRGRVRKTRLSVPRARPRPFTIRPLGAQGLPTGPPPVVARDVDATVRLAGAPDGRLVASWVRPQKIRPYPREARGDAPPPSAYINPVAFTRQLLPRARPARPVGGPAPAVSTPTVAFDVAGQALATLRVASPGGIPASDVVASTSRARAAPGRRRARSRPSASAASIPSRLPLRRATSSSSTRRSSPQPGGLHGPWARPTRAAPTSSGRRRRRTAAGSPSREQRGGSSSPGRWAGSCSSPSPAEGRLLRR